MTWEELAAGVHIGAACAGLLLGAVVLVRAKGTRAHRLLGGCYVGALVLVNAAALSMHREATFGVFHVLALISLITVAVGIAPMLLRSRSPVVVTNHAYCMAWSYAGLVAAGCGQLATSRGGSGGVSLGVIAGVLTASAFLITWQVPKNVASVPLRGA